MFWSAGCSALDWHIIIPAKQHLLLPVGCSPRHHLHRRNDLVDKLCELFDLRLLPVILSLQEVHKPKNIQQAERQPLEDPVVSNSYDIQSRSDRDPDLCDSRFQSAAQE